MGNDVASFEEDRWVCIIIHSIRPSQVEVVAFSGSEGIRDDGSRKEGDGGSRVRHPTEEQDMEW